MNKDSEHREKNGRFTKGHIQYKRKLTLSQVREVKHLLNLGYSTYMISDAFNVSQASIMCIKQGKSYRDVK